MLIVNLGYEQIFGPPSRIRTPNHSGRSSMLSPVELMPEKKTSNELLVMGHALFSAQRVYPTLCFQYRESLSIAILTIAPMKKTHSVKGHQECSAYRDKHTDVPNSSFLKGSVVELARARREELQAEKNPLQAGFQKAPAMFMLLCDGAAYPAFPYRKQWRQ